jgi:ABC-type antimicrobial peptide transport system permease subunit
MGLVFLGALIGVGVSLGAGRVVASQLREIKPHDPVTLAGVLALISVTGFVACWLPARRATKVDPLVALRHD